MKNQISLTFTCLWLTLNCISQNKNNTPESNIEKITLGGGCYWCTEAIFEDLNGVTSVISGFSGGNIPHPTYEEVCSGNTGHAEVIQITYYKDKISTQEILKVFFSIHDPTTLNKQGADVGTQYRSVIFYHNLEQKNTANTIINSLNKAKVFPNPIVTEVLPLKNFYTADEDHQNYYTNNKEKPYCKLVILPKMEKFEKAFANQIKNKKRL